MSNALKINRISEKEYKKGAVSARQTTVQVGDLAINGWFKKTTENKQWFEPMTDGKSYISKEGETKYNKPVTIHKTISQALVSSINQAIENENFPTKENPILVETVKVPSEYEKAKVTLRTETERGQYADVMKDGVFMKGVFFSKDKDSLNFPTGKPYEKDGENVYPSIVVATKEVRNEIRNVYENAVVEEQKNKKFMVEEAEAFEDLDDELLPF